MINKGENLNQIVSKTASKWKTRAKQDRSNRRNISRAQAFALELMDYMNAHGIKQNQLAKRMGVTSQQVNKILRAKSNLTFETLDKIEDALDITVSTAKIIQYRSVNSPVIQNIMKLVYKKPKVIEENISTQVKTSINPVLETSIESMDNYKYTAKQI
jgi:transcriptional regulator with XRE-family HTH domain